MSNRGVVHKGVGGQYRVRMETGEYVDCTVRGRIKLSALSIVVGDRVLVDRKDKTIDQILDRENLLLRPVVANVQTALIVFSAANPSPSYNLLDKILITCEHEFIKPVICINKMDLADVDMSRYASSGYPIFRVSVLEKRGLEELKHSLEGETVVFTGPSGVGKSSLIQALTGVDVVTGKVSQAANRGKHTTTHTEFFELSNGGILIDAPGFGAVKLNFIGRENIKDLYPEFRPYTGCKFSNCLHLEEPECQVKEAANSGEFPIERYQSYMRIMEEL